MRTSSIVAAVAIAVACDGGPTSSPVLEPGPILGECLVEPHYVGQTPLNRWRNFPLRYLVLEDGFPVEDRARILALILDGVGLWAEGTGGRIGTVIPARDDATADLVLEARALEEAAAFTTHATSTPYLARARIVFDRATVVGLAEAQDGALLSALAAHEMGHVLGIIGHPQQENTLMYGLGALRPTAADLNTMSHAYCTSKG
jgi:hypothetical protein